MQLGVLDVAVGRSPSGIAVALFLVIANLGHETMSAERLQPG